MYRKAVISHPVPAVLPHDALHDTGFVPPLPGSGTGAKRTGETISRPLRALLGQCETHIISWSDLAVLEAALPPSEFRRFLTLCLLDAELRLEDIARLRKRQDFSGIAAQARTLAGICGNLGALRASLSARRLDAACRHGDHGATYGLIGDLAQDFEDAQTTLIHWLDAAKA